MRPRSVLITGASRGIGAALARAYAAPGVTLGLLARDETALQAAAETCRRAGAAAVPIPADIRDRNGMRERLLAFDAEHPVDLAIANAGMQLPTGDDAATERATYGEIEVNLLGALNSVLPLIPPMRARGAGQIAFVSSLAGLAPLPDSPGYSASKAALIAYGLATRERLREAGIKVSIACPGYVVTDMGDRYKGWRPLSMSAERAAEHILRGLERDRPIIAFPRSLALLARLSMLVPEPVRRPFMGGFRFTYE
ncbi:SDR family NAD(P)-dependent oxidoreductase [Enterovirga aerilata]|uniref:SDR family NAD(P)-dependent oxidoreductase n=1 Tax=Enterovirga aerilata TaxID=2730920 RepID=A0A849I1C1_9HYPH|nr:SDR family NAD(P)-dependent oxidoreductase [Enterovirga sp. DB1703]NNM73576.1 SDR family NAD(P)-dependent oxidoreductase [Enterovirga sp. DB1703]